MQGSGKEPSSAESLKLAPPTLVTTRISRALSMQVLNDCSRVEARVQRAVASRAENATERFLPPRSLPMKPASVGATIAKAATAAMMVEVKETMFAIVLVGLRSWKEEC